MFIFITILLTSLAILLTAGLYIYYKYLYAGFNYIKAKGLETDDMSSFNFTYNEIFNQECYAPLQIPKEEAVVLDIGGNIGLFSLYVDSICDKATIYSFEPIPALYQLINKNVPKNIKNTTTFKAFNIGVSAQEEQLPIHHMVHGSAMSSFVDNSEDKFNAYEAIAPFPKLYAFGNKYIFDKTQEKVDAQLRPLSDVIEEQELIHIHAVKIDVEGYELEVLKGIQPKHFKIIDRFMIEVENFREGLLDDILTLLRANGFNDIKVNKEDEPWCDVIAGKLG